MKQDDGQSWDLGLGTLSNCQTCAPKPLCELAKASTFKETYIYILISVCFDSCVCILMSEFNFY